MIREQEKAAGLGNIYENGFVQKCVYEMHFGQSIKGMDSLFIFMNRDNNDKLNVDFSCSWVYN